MPDTPAMPSISGPEPSRLGSSPLLRLLARQGTLPSRVVSPGGVWAVLHTVGEVRPPESALSAPNLIVIEPARTAAPDDADSPAPPWLPSSRAAVDAALLEIEAAHPDASLILWPHALGAISDAPSLRTFLRARGVSGGGRWRFIYDAAALLTPPMRTNLDDHLLRWSEVLLTHPDLAGVLLCEHSPAVPVPGPTPLTRDAALSTALLRLLPGIPGNIPIILLDALPGSFATQAALLAAAGGAERRTI